MESFFRENPNTTVFVWTLLEPCEEINIWVWKEWWDLSLQVSEEISKIRERCFNCLFRWDFDIREDNQLIVSCEKGYSTNRVDFKCWNYKRDKWWKATLWELDINLS